MVGTHAAGRAGQRDDGAALDLLGLEPDAGVTEVGRADEAVERHTVDVRQ